MNRFPLVFLAISALFAANSAAAAERPIKAVVVTGGHKYDQKAFANLFADQPGIEFTFVELKDQAEMFDDVSQWPYDVIVFYHMTKTITEPRQANFKALLDRGVGVVALHHTIWAWEDWSEFARIIGGKQFHKAMSVDGKDYPKSTYKEGIDISVHVAAAHPITAGLSDFTIHDETYHGAWIDPAATVLLTTDNPTSDAALAWCKTYGKARTACIQLGHGTAIFSEPNYRKFLANAIRWTAAGGEKK